MNPARARATRRLIAASAVFTASLASPAPARAQTTQSVRVVTDSAGSRLQVDGRDFLVKGMNWDYLPIGENYSYSLWSQPDDIIRAALDREFGLLRAMGVNVVRQYAGVPPRWVAYIYNTYGIWTAINHPLGRYGTTVGGMFTPNTDYSDPRARRALLTEVGTLADQFSGTPGVLMYIIGNENNYGLAWKSAATEALPAGERDAAKARYLYSLVGEAARLVHQRDPARPVALANGDLQYIDIIAAEAKGIDIFGSNVYRGASAGDFFQVVKTKLGVPAMFTEFGADAYNAREMREDQAMQARYLVAQWREIEEQTSGKGGGRAGNAIGGFVFQWSDGWWKVGQTVRLDVHDTDAGWPNAAYSDFTAGDNNMNEEWWGVVAKGAPDARGLFQLYPRAAYYALEQVFQFDPYAPGTTLATVDARFDAIDPALLALRARSDKGAQVSDEASRFRLSGMRLYLATFTTGGTSLSTPRVGAPNPTAYPSARGFDHLESFFTDFEARPADNVIATLSLNLLGHVPNNPVDQIFYENRGRVRNVQTADGQVVPLEGNERVKVYRASLQWDERDFGLAGFYRTGHYHWGYQGDFFGLYREANYGPNIDIYNGNAPIGVEFTGKRSLTGLSAAFGPELWWGANPALLVKYGRQVGPLRLTGVFQDDIGTLSSSSSSFAIPLPPTKTATLAAETMVGPLGVEVG
ncbi:MAG TPA: hypothetical protein VFN39_07710, partial [Gemmatimonadaceae bacterium]|nr:hypothetical protein [Gemmatimonadaceae bacterium]